MTLGLYSQMATIHWGGVTAVLSSSLACHSPHHSLLCPPFKIMFVLQISHTGIKSKLWYNVVPKPVPLPNKS